MGRSGVFCPACSDPGQQWTVEIAFFLRLNGFDNQDDFGYNQILVLNVAICTFSFAASTHWPCMLATLHFQATTCTISDICLPMSSRLMLRKHSLFFSSAGLLRPGGRAATASFTFDTGRAVTHGLQLELKKAVATRIRVWAFN